MRDCEHRVNGCGSSKSSEVEMNGAVMTSGARCLCAQAPVPQASAGALVGGNGLPIALRTCEFAGKFCGLLGECR